MQLRAYMLAAEESAELVARFEAFLARLAPFFAALRPPFFAALRPPFFAALRPPFFAALRPPFFAALRPPFFAALRPPFFAPFLAGAMMQTLLNRRLWCSLSPGGKGEPRTHHCQTVVS